MAYETWNQGSDQPRKRRECFSPRHGLKEKEVGQSAIARLGTPKPYQFDRLCDRIDQQEWDRKRADAALMKEDTTHDTSSPQTEDKVKNQHVQAVEVWISTAVKETLFDYIKSKALENLVEKRINEEMARSTLEMNLEEPCEEIVMDDVTMAMKKTVSAMICFGTMKEVVGNHIVNSIDFDEQMAVAIKTIMKNKLMQERVLERAEKRQEEEEEVNMIAGIVNGE
jgi:hypothetical protein